MKKQRFFYNKSTIYGWCVYDRETATPAYEACAELLPPVHTGADGSIFRTPLTETETRAMLLCASLNRAYNKTLRK